MHSDITHVDSSSVHVQAWWLYYIEISNRASVPLELVLIAFLMSAYVLLLIITELGILSIFSRR